MTDSDTIEYLRWHSVTCGDPRGGCQFAPLGVFITVCHLVGLLFKERKVEGIDYVICPICETQMTRITWKHTWFKHGLKWDKFKAQFPDVLTICKQSSEKTSTSGKNSWDNEQRKEAASIRSIANWLEGGVFRSEGYKKAHLAGITQSVERLRKEGRYEPDSPWVLNLSYHATKQWEEGLHEKEWSKERKKKLSGTKTQQWIDGTYDCMVGENHYNWKGGISLEPYGEEWTDELKEQIRQRDSRKCQLCGMTEEIHKSEYRWSLSVHHINYIKTDHRPENLTALCIRCHTKTNHNREHWKAYFQGKQKEEIYKTHLLF